MSAFLKYAGDMSGIRMGIKLSEGTACESVFKRFFKVDVPNPAPIQIIPFHCKNQAMLLHTIYTDLALPDRHLAVSHIGKKKSYILKYAGDVPGTGVGIRQSEGTEYESNEFILLRTLPGWGAKPLPSLRYSCLLQNPSSGSLSEMPNTFCERSMPI